MKEKIKNFIAFTLSEMMIVLLIFSVISAATLPVITTRKENPNPNISGTSSSGIWGIENFTGGIYYDTYNNATDRPYPVVMNSLENPFGGAVLAGNGKYYPMSLAVLLLSKEEDLLSSGTNSNYHLNIQGNSLIEFTEQNTSQSNDYITDGRIAMDYANSVFIGYGNNLYEASFVERNEKSTLIGNYLGDQKISAPGSTIIGSYSGYYTGTQNISEYQPYTYSSVLIGTHITPYNKTSENVQMGYYAGYNAKTYSKATKSSLYSILIGSAAGYNLTPRESVVIGSEAAQFEGLTTSSRKTVTSTNDVIIGEQAGQAKNVSSIFNVKIGTYAGVISSSGSSLEISGHNVLIGYYANAGFERSVSIGAYAGDGSKSSSYTTLIGQKAGYMASDDITGAVFIGSYAGANQTEARSSVFVGHYAGYKHTGESALSMDYSVGVGEYALSRTIGNDGNPRDGNVCIGAYACSNTKAIITNNTAIGRGVMGTLDTGAKMDKALLIGQGCSSSSAVNWSGNICISGLVDASSKTLLGTRTHANGSTTTYSAWSKINPGSTVRTFIAPSIPAGSGVTGYNNSSIVLYAAKVYSFGSLISYSDRRLKQNIKLVNSSLDKLRKLNVYEYNMKKESPKNVKIGVIAQELKEIYPNAVHMFNNYLSVNSDWVVYSTIRAIKDLDKIVQNAQQKLQLAKSNYNKLQARVDNIEIRLNKISHSNKMMIIKIDEIEQAKKMERK